MSNYSISSTFQRISGSCQAAERAQLPSCAWMTSPEVLMRLLSQVPEHCGVFVDDSTRYNMQGPALSQPHAAHFLTKIILKGE